MRIISKFQDYYDSCRGYGIDPKLVYIRKTQEIKIGWNEYRETKELELLGTLQPLFKIRGKMPSFFLECNGVIAFCGTAYPFYLFEDKAYFTLTKLTAAIQSSDHDCKDDYLHSILKKESKKSRWWRYRYGSLSPQSWADFYEEANLSIPDSLHIYFKSPVVMMLEGKVVINPRLNKYNFASQVDPFTAYQELSMYVGNNLVNQMDPEVRVSDKIRAESRGFDKWSFRRHKDESKKNKK